MRLGHVVFWDQSIPTGSTWRETIGRELDAAKVLLACWSEHTVEASAAHWVLDEVDEAKRQEKMIIPVLLDAVEPPLGHRQTQALNLRDWTGLLADPRFLALAQSVGAAVFGGGGAPATSFSIAPKHTPYDLAQLHPLVGSVALLARQTQQAAIRESESARVLAQEAIRAAELARQGDPNHMMVYFDQEMVNPVEQALQALRGLPYNDPSRREAEQAYENAFKAAINEEGRGYLMFLGERSARSSSRHVGECYKGNGLVDMRLLGVTSGYGDYYREPRLLAGIWREDAVAFPKFVGNINWHTSVSLGVWNRNDGDVWFIEYVETVTKGHSTLRIYRCVVECSDKRRFEGEVADLGGEKSHPQFVGLGVMWDATGAPLFSGKWDKGLLVEPLAR